MTMKKYVLMFLLLSWRVPVPLLQGSHHSSNIRLEERIVLGESEESWILDARGIAIVEGDKIVISDKLDYRVKKFDCTGRKIAEAGRRGGGPGEFRGPGPVASGAGLLAIADFASARIQLFSSTLVYRSGFSAPAPAFDIAFDRGGYLWLAVLSSRTGENLVRADLSGHIVQTIGLKNSSNLTFDNLFYFAVGSKGDRVVAFAFQNKIEIWDSAGTLRNDFHISGIPERPREKIVVGGGLVPSRGIPLDDVFRGVAIDSKDNIYLLAGEYTKVPDQDVYVLDRAGNVKTILTLPRRSYRIFIGPKDELFSIEKDRMVVRGYTMKGGE
jgi:hypothetical protein